MTRCQIKLRGDCSLLATVAQQAGVGTIAESQPERVEKDGLAGPGFPSEGTKTGGEGQVQLLDQHQIPDGKAVQAYPLSISKDPDNDQETGPYPGPLLCLLCGSEMIG